LSYKIIFPEQEIYMRLQGRAREAFERLVLEHPTASKEELFELFQIAVESDARVRESLTHRIFDDMREFDPSRAMYVIGLVKGDHPEAIVAVKLLLSQMRKQ
jgi:hypothetical protein